MDAIRDSLGNMRLADDLADQIASMASALGFSTFSLGYANPQLSGQSFWIEQMPVYTWDAVAGAARDPVSAAVLASKEAKTIIWSEETYVAAGAGDLWELGNSIGINSGIAHVARPGSGRRMMLSMDRGAKFDGTHSQQLEQASKLGQFADLLAGAVVSLFDMQHIIEHDLTKVELEALKWVFGMGYTEYQVSERLNVSLAQACHLLQSAADKIGVANHVQAGMIAARHGALGAI